MPESVASRQRTDNHDVYSSSLAHLSDELKRLDLLIHFEVLKQRNREPANPLDQFKGLVISEEEIAGLLTGASDGSLDERGTDSDESHAKLLAESQSRLELLVQERRAVSLEKGIHLCLPRLSQLFNLNRFEEGCILICLAPELDLKYEKLYAYLQDDVTRRKPSVDLVLKLLCGTDQHRINARVAFDPRAPLLKYRLLQPTDNPSDGSIPLLSRLLKLDDRIADFLIGSNHVDGRIERAVGMLQSANRSTPESVDQQLRDRLVSFIRSDLSSTDGPAERVVFNLSGRYGAGKATLVESVCREIGLPVVVGDLAKLLNGSLPFEEAALLLCREALLQPAALCLENFDALNSNEEKNKFYLECLLDAVRTFSRVTFLLSARPRQLEQSCTRSKTDSSRLMIIDVELPATDDLTRKRLWEQLWAAQGEPAGGIDFGALASKFKFTPGQIRDAFLQAQAVSRWRSNGSLEAGVLPQITEADLHAASRAQSNSKLTALARKIEPKYRWEDIVLPPDSLEQLKEICDHSRNRYVVFGEWGFDRKLSLGKGLNALFSGPPGTGKTMAAEVIANELQLDLYKIDLSQVVSKYIGETEKNLDKIFAEAQTSNAILFFDEADALFGKRSEVKDAHDRYANIEIGYLLQKMEEYEGIAILATNVRQNMDEAFVRRMQFIVEFPFPDEEHRRRIWQVIFPREAPIGGDVDFNLLAREIKLAGGNIKNIALRAAFYAAEDGVIIRVPHLVRAAQREYQKLGRTWGGIELTTQGAFVS